jgi:hypothetical protein
MAQLTMIQQLIFTISAVIILFLIGFFLVNWEIKDKP